MVFQRAGEAQGFGVFDGEIFLESNTKKTAHKFCLGYTNAFMAIQNRKIEVYYEINHMKKESMHGLKLFSNPKQVKSIQKEEKKLIKSAENMVNHFFKIKLETLSNTALLYQLDKYIHAYEKVHGFYHLTQPQYFEQFNLSIQKELIAQGLDALEIFLELSTPNKPSIIVQEFIDRKKMFIKFLNNKRKEPLLKKHLKKYRFLQASEGQRPWNEKTLLQNFTENKKDMRTLQKEVSTQQQYYQLLKKKQLATIHKYHISHELQQKFAVLRHFGNSRLLVRYAWTALIRPYSSILYEVARRTNITGIKLEDYCIQEVKDLLIKGKKVPEKELRARVNFSIIGLQNGKWIMKSGKEAELFYNVHVPKEKITDFVKGMIANKGVAEGIAKVIRFDENIVEQMNSMKRGQILIAGQTRPILMPAIEKASAIVTDEGGITSHAAIVSREFNIPCIVGTHNATRIFKDGEKILVDANNGIAKKVK